MKQNFISVIVSTYNSLQKLKTFLRCTRLQTYRNFQIVVADDGSYDGTVEYVNSLYNQFGPLRVFTQQDLGFRLAKARNMGVKHALGDYCLFSDADCLFDEKFIRGYNTLINAFPESFIGGKRRRIPIRDQGNIKLDPQFLDFDYIKTVAYPEPALYPDDYVGRVQNENLMLGCNFLRPRKAIVQVNGFDEDFVGWGGEQNDLCNRAKRLGYKFYVSGRQVVYHLQHGQVADRNGIGVYRQKVKDTSIIRNPGRDVFSC